MKKINLIALLFMMLCAITLSSCGKDDEVEPSREELLTSGAWRGDKILVSGTDASQFPGAEGFVPDPSTITITFNKDGTYTGQFIQNGQPVPISGTWELSDDDKTLNANFFNLSSEAKIEDLGKNILRLSTSVRVPNFPFPLPVEIWLVR